MLKVWVPFSENGGPQKDLPPGIAAQTKGSKAQKTLGPLLQKSSYMLADAFTDLLAAESLYHGVPHSWERRHSFWKLESATSWISACQWKKNARKKWGDFPGPEVSSNTKDNIDGEMLIFQDPPSGPKRASYTCRKSKFDRAKVSMSMCLTGGPTTRLGWGFWLAPHGSFRRSSYQSHQGVPDIPAKPGVYTGDEAQGQAVCPPCSHLMAWSLSWENLLPVPVSESISTSSGFSTQFPPVLMIHNEQHEDGGEGRGSKTMGILFRGTMGEGYLRKTIQGERKRTSILLRGINVWLSSILSSWGKAKTNLTFGQSSGWELASFLFLLHHS